MMSILIIVINKLVFKSNIRYNVIDRNNKLNGVTTMKTVIGVNELGQETRNGLTKEQTMQHNEQVRLANIAKTKAQIVKVELILTVDAKNQELSNLLKALKRALSKDEKLAGVFTK